MKKTRFGIVVGTLGTMVLSTFACIVLSKQKNLNFTGFATGEYTCDLPDNTYDEIQIVNQAISVLEPDVVTPNPYKFRGTVTRRFGDFAYLQRRNQATNYIDAIKITGLDTYGDDIAEGNVVDISGGSMVLHNGLAEFIFDDTVQYNIAFNTNPTGYQPLQYEGCGDYFNRGTNDSLTGDQYYTFYRYIQLNRVKLWEPTPTGQIDFPEGNFCYSSVYDFDNNLNEILVTFATNDDAFSDIVARTDTAIANDKLINIRGIVNYAYGYINIYIDSADDIDVLEDAYYDTNVVAARTDINYRLAQGDDGYLSIPAYYLDGDNDVLYSEALETINNVWYIFGGHTNPYINCIANDPYDQNVLYLFREGEAENGYYKIDATNDTFTIHKDNSRFGELFPRRTALDVRYQSSGYETTYCQIDNSLTVAHNMYYEHGDKTYYEDIVYDLGAFGLDIVRDGYNRFYVPMTLLADMITGYPGYSWAFNGAEMFLIPQFLDNNENFDYEYFYSTSPWVNQNTRSSEMAEYTYNAFCFQLKYFYGLSDIRIESNPDAKISELGYKTRLLSTDTLEYETAFAEFVGEWFFEGHSGYISPSPYVANELSSVYNAYYSELVDNTRYQQLVNNSSTLNDLREEARESRGDPEAVGLRIFEDIAVITFDHFVKYTGNNSSDVWSHLDDYSYTELQDLGSELLFRKAFNEIEDHNASAAMKVSNIVIDLSLNTGGMVDALPWLGAYLCEHPSLCINYRNTGECDEVYYNVDIDYDGDIDTDDTYADDFRFFCITSPVSFSCGNNFPTYLKTKGLATIIGQQSGGGLCIVGRMATASGTVIRNSSNMHLGAWDDYNGVFVGSETGITPDIYLDYEDFYGETALYAVIHSV